MVRGKVSLAYSLYHQDEFEEYDQQSKDGSAWKSQFPSSQVAIRPDLHAATPQLSSLKPRFLSELEEFLGNELDSLGVTAVKPNETRLQVSVYLKYGASDCMSL